MTLAAYLLETLVDERATIEELLSIDNSIQQTDLTYNNLIEKVKKVTILEVLPKRLSNVVIDGDPDTTYTILITFAPYIKNLYINRTFVAINKWLVERTKEYYYSQQLNIDISLDIERGCSKYLEDDLSIILYGFSEFTEGMKDIFLNKDVFVIDK